MATIPPRTLSHLDRLEAEAIHILREVAGQCANPVLLFSGGKDSICLLRLAEKAFRPGHFPFPLMHIDTGHNYQEVVAFRDKRAAQLGERLIVRSVEDSMARGTVVLKSAGESRNKHQSVTLLEAIEANTTLLDECDVVVPVTKIPDFLTYAKSLKEDHGFTIKSFGHAGDGNLHVYTCSNDMEEAEFNAQVEDFMKKVYAKATELGGLISGEHGIGCGKMEYLKDFVGPVNMRIMKGIKEVFDPNMILNPGKVCYELN